MFYKPLRDGFFLSGSQIPFVIEGKPTQMPELGRLEKVLFECEEELLVCQSLEDMQQLYETHSQKEIHWYKWIPPSGNLHYAMC